ncbi:MAG: hypothetical protein ACRD43_13215 [Pyrinomonadaceae bacterium]
MKFARYTFLIAGVYGLFVLLPIYFSEQKVGTDYPPAITHPEYLYGFAGVAIAFQFIFLIIAKNPLKYRLMILPSLIEKLSFGIAVVVLQIQNRIPMPMFAGGMIDILLALLFIASYFKLSKAAAEKGSA